MPQGNLGIQNSRQCGDLIAQFYDCQKRQGMWQKVGGACLEAREQMDKCLYEEYVQRRTSNLAAAQERMKRYAELNREGES